MPVGPLTPIAGPQNRPVRGGLLAVAPQPAVDGERWTGGGVGVEPETCAGAQVLDLACGASDEKEFPDPVPAVTAESFLVIGADRCSTMGGARPTQARAVNHLRATEGAAVERVLWVGSGDPAAVDPQRPHLQASTADVLAGGAAMDLFHGLALLDQALTTRLHGATGMIHVTPYVLARAKGVGFLERAASGAGWVSPNGHDVVGGAGYTGGGPKADADDPAPAGPDLEAAAPADQWAYGTDAVNVILGPVAQLPGVDHRINDAAAYAERAAVAYFVCAHVAVQLDLALPA